MAATHCDDWLLQEGGVARRTDDAAELFLYPVVGDAHFPPEDVDVMVLLPAQDGDVSENPGQKHYDLAKPVALDVAESSRGAGDAVGMVERAGQRVIGRAVAAVIRKGLGPFAQRSALGRACQASGAGSANSWTDSSPKARVPPSSARPARASASR